MHIGSLALGEMCVLTRYVVLAAALRLGKQNKTRHEKKVLPFKGLLATIIAADGLPPVACFVCDGCPCWVCGRYAAALVVCSYVAMWGNLAAVRVLAGKYRGLPQ